MMEKLHARPAVPYAGLTQAAPCPYEVCDHDARLSRPFCYPFNIVPCKLLQASSSPSSDR